MGTLGAVHHVRRAVVPARLVAAVVGGGRAGAGLVLVRRVRLIVLARLTQVRLEEVLEQLLQCDHMLVLERINSINLLLLIAKISKNHINDQ